MLLEKLKSAYVYVLLVGFVRLGGRLGVWIGWGNPYIFCTYFLKWGASASQAP